MALQIRLVNDSGVPLDRVVMANHSRSEWSDGKRGRLVLAAYSLPAGQTAYGVLEVPDDESRTSIEFYAGGQFYQLDTGNQAFTQTDGTCELTIEAPGSPGEPFRTSGWPFLGSPAFTANETLSARCRHRVIEVHIDDALVGDPTYQPPVTTAPALAVQGVGAETIFWFVAKTPDEEVGLAGLSVTARDAPNDFPTELGYETYTTPPDGTSSGFNPGRAMFYWDPSNEVKRWFKQHPTDRVTFKYSFTLENEETKKTKGVDPDVVLGGPSAGVD